MHPKSEFHTIKKQFLVNRGHSNRVANCPSHSCKYPFRTCLQFRGGGIIKPFLVRVSVFMAIIIKITAFEGYDYTLITNFMH